MLTKINVTAEDISDGLPQCSTDCALARAIARHLKKPFYPSVSLGLLTVKMEVGEHHHYESHNPLPPEATDFIRAFDAGEDCLPFTFSVHLPNDTLRPLAPGEDTLEPWHPEGWDFIEGGPDVA